MIHVQDFIVVEAKTDVSFLSQFLNATFLTTNGLNVDDDLIQQIGSFLPHPGVILLTDPDGPGKSIRQQILRFYPDIKNAYISASKSRIGRKVGVAQSTHEEVMTALANLVNFNSVPTHPVSIVELADIGYAGTHYANQLRTAYAEAHHLGHSNAKLFLKKINALGISVDQLIQWKVDHEQANRNR
jgi:ribonuclease M5